MFSKRFNIVHLSVCLGMWRVLSVYLSVCLCVYVAGLSVYLSVCLCVCGGLCQCICQSACVCMWLASSVYLSVCLCVYVVGFVSLSDGLLVYVLYVAGFVSVSVSLLLCVFTCVTCFTGYTVLDISIIMFSAIMKQHSPELNKNKRKRQKVKIQFNSSIKQQSDVSSIAESPECEPSANSYESDHDQQFLVALDRAAGESQKYWTRYQAYLESYKDVHPAIVCSDVEVYVLGGHKGMWIELCCSV